MLKSRETATYALMWARLNNNLSVSEVERKTGYNRVTILRIETGEQSPSLEYLQAFAYMLDISTSELVEILEDKKLATHAMQIAKAVNNMRKSIKACELQKNISWMQSVMKDTEL